MSENKNLIYMGRKTEKGIGIIYDLMTRAHWNGPIWEAAFATLPWKKQF